METRPNLNPMFRPKENKRKPNWSDLNVRNPQPKPARKQRGDKKHDIKISLTKEDMKELRSLAFQHNVAVTHYAGYLLKKGLQRDASLYPETDYVTTNPQVHAKLSKVHYEKLFEFSLEFELTSMRKTANRILTEMIRRGGE